MAKHEGKFLYWSDIEDGWELEALQAGGALEDRGCNQFELQHIMYKLFGDPDQMPLNLSDYLIDQQRYEWSTILTEWHWLIPADLTIWMVNRFGDVIFVSEDGAVHLLDIGAGSVKQLAASREDFFTQVEADDNADNWLLISLTDKCISAGLTLNNGECYGYKIAPVFGGEYVTENIEVTDLVVNFSLMAQIHQQSKDLPDGTRINVVVAA